MVEVNLIDFCGERAYNLRISSRGKNMKNGISRIFGVAIAAFVCFAGLSAQDRDAIAAAAGDKYVISAKAGGVNFVTGAVGVVRSAGKSGYLLKGDKLAVGDRVSTGADGKAEILLNPGSYLRLGPSSAIEFKTTALEDLQIRLDSGSAMFEVFAAEDFTVTVSTPKSSTVLIESGVYRVDVEADGTGKVAVWKGKAQLGDDAAAIVKSGREAAISAGQASIVKFDRDDKDELEIWSKERAKELAKLTGKLQRDNMRTSLMRSYLGRSWNMYNSFGLWVYDPFSRNHCFLPFGLGWGSPYGYGFGNSLWYYNLPGVVYYPPVQTGGPVRQVKPGRVRAMDRDNMTPPFAAVQGKTGATGRDVMPMKPGRSIGVDPLGSDPVRSSGGFPTMGSGGSGGSSGSGASDIRPVQVKSGRN